MGRVMQIAAFSLAEVTYAVGGDIGFQIQESAKSARFRIRTRQENVSGVLLPQFESYTTEGNDDFGLTGLGKGGQQVQRCRETYARAVETLVELASLQVCASAPAPSGPFLWLPGSNPKKKKKKDSICNLG
jgi:V-type H+-transporting ATPase subunit D